MLNKAGYNGVELLDKANAPTIKTKLRENTAEAQAAGICGVPTYRVFREGATGQWEPQGGLIWGQDETNVVEDTIAGWRSEERRVGKEWRSGRSGAEWEDNLCAALRV